MTTSARLDRSGLFGRAYVLTTVGSSSLVFLAAFEALAVTTVMPIIADDLGGRSLYSLAFAATMAAGVVGMVASGAWADRRGPGRPLLTSIAVFAAGLAVAGASTSMTVFVAARFLQGLGAGGITVALYVLVARVYPPELHPRIFGLYAAAWVVPSMVGPSVAGLVAEELSWHWVFLGVLALVGVVTTIIIPVVRRDSRQATTTPATTTPAAGSVRRIVAALVVAGAVVLLSIGGAVLWPVTLIVIAVAVRGLLPPGAYRVRRGLPATVVLCGAAGATFFSTEVYLPLLLHDRYGLPSWLSGVTLTTGAVAWALGSDLQGRFGGRLSHETVIRGGAALLAAGAAAELAVVAFTLAPAAAAVGWFLAGGGMGLMYPRVSTVVLADSPPGEQGFNTAAKSIADAVGGSVALAVSGLIFHAVAGGTAAVSFVAVFTFSVAVGLLTVGLSMRVGIGRASNGAGSGR
jgi:MFS family permease